MKAVWTAAHRWDLPVDDPVWLGFDQVMHNGWERQERIRWMYTHLRTVVYVYPYAVFRRDTGEPVRFHTGGNLLEGTADKLPILPNSGTITPTNGTIGHWVDWSQVDLERAIAFIQERAPAPRSVVGFMIDNIPEWARVLGSESRLAEQLEYVVKLLLNIKPSAWIVGNVYTGQRGLKGCLQAGVGCYFEQSFWYWYSGNWLPQSQQDANYRRILSVLHAGQKAIIHVPAMPKTQHERAIALLQNLAKDAGVATLELSEFRWSGPTRSSLVGGI